MGDEAARVLLPLLVLGVPAFWLWQFLAWIVARGRWARIYGNEQRRSHLRPRFMDSVARHVAGALVEGASLLRALGALFLIALPVVASSALLFFVLVIVVLPLVPAFGLLGALAIGGVVSAGIMVPFIMAQMLNAALYKK